MRTDDTLFELEDITILFQFLYMSPEHFVIVDNGLTKLKITMNEHCYFLADNLKFPDLPALIYTEQMNIPNILGIIDQLKNIPADEFKETFSSKWEELKAITLADLLLNKKQKGIRK